MSSTSYQPFLISSFKTGLFQYLQPWIRSQDAFEPLKNAFVYRGMLQKRNGQFPLGDQISVTNIQIAVGNGGTTYSGTLKAHPVHRGTFNPTGGSESFTDQGDGSVLSSAGGDGTINYDTGAWTLDFGAPVAIATPITVSYLVDDGHIAYKDWIAFGAALTVTYSGTLLVNPILGGSFSATDGVETFTDNGDGTLTGSAGGTGTINYSTGAWSLTFNANPGVNAAITATYSPQIPTGGRPIMGLKQWTSESTSETTLVALDTRRASKFNTTTQMFQPINSVVQVLWVGDNSTTSISFTTGWVNVSPYPRVFQRRTISITDGTSTITDTPVTPTTGNLSAAGNFAAGGTVNYATGVIHLEFGAATTATITLTTTLEGDYFSGNVTNFFNSTNWLGNLYLTNNADPITLYDGTNLSRPPFPITLSHKTSYTNDIQRCLDVDVYKNRLLVQRPTLVGAGSPSGQSIRYSALQNPTNLVADVPGNGGELSAPTDDFMMSSEFLRDQFIVLFQNSAWAFRFTGSSFDPFRFDKLNDTKSTNAPYATIPYDQRITAMGLKGLIACDGVNVQRYDVEIIDEFQQVNPDWFGQCFGQRFDTINQSWMLFPSDDALENAYSAILSDSVLVYNILENNWAVYSTNLNCLGLFHATTDVTWADFALGGSHGPLTWAQADFPWDEYANRDGEPTLLGGGQEGIVYTLDEGVYDFNTPITSNVTSTQWNPFTNLGQKIQFGYVDFYYQVQPDCTIDLQFAVDNYDSNAIPRTITLDAPPLPDGSPSTQTKCMKRIYINAMGEFLKMNMISSSTAPFAILGLVLWARPAGRLTP